MSRTLKLVTTETLPAPMRRHTPGADMIIASGDKVIIVVEHEAGWVSLDYSPDEARSLAAAIASAAGNADRAYGGAS